MEAILEKDVNRVACETSLEPCLSLGCPYMGAPRMAGYCCKKCQLGEGHGKMCAAVEAPPAQAAYIVGATKWPVRFESPRYATRPIRMWPFRMPAEIPAPMRLCHACAKLFAPFEPAVGNPDVDQEEYNNGYYLCARCWAASGTHFDPGPPECVEQGAVTVVACENVTGGLPAANCTLLPPGSDCGIPQARGAPGCTITYDLGQDGVMWDSVEVVTWYHNSYPGKVLLHCSESLEESEAPLEWELIGQAQFEQKSGAQAIQADYMSYARFVRVTFVHALGNTDELRLGTVQFCCSDQ